MPAGCRHSGRMSTRGSSGTATTASRPLRPPDASPRRSPASIRTDRFVVYHNPAGPRHPGPTSPACPLTANDVEARTFPYDIYHPLEQPCAARPRPRAARRPHVPYFRAARAGLGSSSPSTTSSSTTSPAIRPPLGALLLPTDDAPGAAPRPRSSPSPRATARRPPGALPGAATRSGRARGGGPAFGRGRRQRSRTSASATTCRALHPRRRRRRFHKNLQCCSKPLLSLDGWSTARAVLAGEAHARYHDDVPGPPRLGLGDRLLELGHVPDADLPALYTLADLYAVPSLGGGFGLRRSRRCPRGRRSSPRTPPRSRRSSATLASSPIRETPPSSQGDRPWSATATFTPAPRSASPAPPVLLGRDRPAPVCSAGGRGRGDRRRVGEAT
jgi:hypothetical protein